MAQNEYYPEDVLVGKMQSGEYGWLDYVNHFSADWQEEYARYCEEKGLQSATNPPPSSSASRTNSWRQQWKAETHNETIRLWRYERIPIPGRWTCSPKCAIC